MLIDIKKLLTSKVILIIILLFAFISRTATIDYPNTYVFDEVYHGFTAKEYLAGHKEAWEWWTTPPPGVAYEWTHPPLAKEIMAISMFLFNTTDAWAYRLPGVLFSILSIYLIYLLSKQLFRSEHISLLAAFLYSLEGLNFVQSRTGMNDIYFLTFALGSLYLMLKKKFFFSALLLGASISSKWTGVYLLPMIIFFMILQKYYKYIFYYFLIPPLIYLLSYLPFFLLGHTLEQFQHLQWQMWYYHTHLKAHHDYASPWWSWPFNLYPVWYFVQYHQNGTISNIFASSNPVLLWLGIVALILSIWSFIETRSRQLLFLLMGFFIFWLPWALSPRIMFLYHFTPSIPFLVINLAFQLNHLWHKKSDRTLLFIALGFTFLTFILMYPILVGLPLEKESLLLFFRTNLTKNPFGG